MNAYEFTLVFSLPHSAGRPVRGGGRHPRELHRNEPEPITPAARAGSADGSPLERGDLLLLRRLDAGSRLDAWPRITAHRHLVLDCVEHGDTAEEAVLAALDVVTERVSEARLIEARPDYVDATDVAALLGVSRQNVRGLLLRASEPPPSPVHAGPATIWHLAEMLEWLVRVKGYKVDRPLRELAEWTMQMNLAIASAAADRAAQEVLRDHL